MVQTAFLGDVVLTTPLLSSLAARHGPVDVLVRPESVALLEGLPSVREVIGYDKRGGESGLAAWLRLARRLETRRYQRAYLPHRSLRSAALARWARIPERIGFDDSAAAWLYTRTVPRPRGLHESERLLTLAGPRPLVPPPIQVSVSEDDRAQAYAWLASHGIGDGFAALAPGSVWATKRWPAFGELIKLVKGRVVVVGGKEDVERAQQLVDVAPDRVVSAAGVLSIRVSAALLERAGVLVTNDSAPLHLASAVGTPTVAVFGPTIPAFGFGPKAPRSAIVERTDLGCRPCSDHGPERCPLGHHRCMREIPAAAVRDAIHQLIGP